MENNYRTIQKLITILSAFFLLLIFIAGGLTWRYGDDYLISLGFKKYQIFEYAIYLYNNWDGRHLTLPGIIQLYILKYLQANISVIIYILVYIVTILVIRKIILIYKDFFAIKKIPNALLMSSLFFIAVWPLFKDVVFWQTGGAYCIHLLQGVILIYLALHFSYNKTLTNLSFIRLEFLFIFCFLLSASSQNLSLPILILASFLLVYKIGFVDKNRFIKYAIFIIIPIIIGIIYISIAPGNFIRMKNEIILPINEMPINYLNILFKFLIYSKWSFLSGISLGLLTIVEKQSKVQIKNIILIGISCLLLAFISLLPFSISSTLARIRVYFFPMFFLWLAGWCIGIFLLKYFNKKVILIFPAICLLIFFSYFMANQILIMAPFSNKIQERRLFLEKNKGSNQIIRYEKLIIPNDLVIIRWPNKNKAGDWNWTKEYYDFFGYDEF